MFWKTRNINISFKYASLFLLCSALSMFLLAEAHGLGDREGSRAQEKKMNVFGKKFDTIRAKINRTNYILHNVFFWMIILTIPEKNIIDFFSLIWYHGHFFPLKKTVGHINCNRTTIKVVPFYILHVGLYLFIDVWLLALKSFTYLRKLYLGKAEWYCCG